MGEKYTVLEIYELGNATLNNKSVSSKQRQTNKAIELKKFAYDFYRLNMTSSVFHRKGTYAYNKLYNVVDSIHFLTYYFSEMESNKLSRRK